MCRLGHRQIKIAVKLLLHRIVVRMNHLGVRRIRNLVSFLHCMRRKKHILVKNNRRFKSAELLKQIPAVCSAHVRAEKSLNAKPRYVLTALDASLIGIIKLSGIALDDAAVLPRELPCIRDRNRIFGWSPRIVRTGCERMHQMFHQPFVCRHRILCHEYQNIRFGIPRSHIPGTTVVKVLSGHVKNAARKRKLLPNLFDRILPYSLIPQCFLGINQNKFMYNKGLLLQFLQEQTKSVIRFVSRNYDIYTHQ